MHLPYDPYASRILFGSILQVTDSIAFGKVQLFVVGFQSVRRPSYLRILLDLGTIESNYLIPGLILNIK